MFDPKSVESYQRIKAPDSLQERVLRASPKKHLRLSPMFGILAAAALALVFFSVSHFSAAPTGVTVGGLAVAEQVTALPAESVPMMARMGAATSQTVVFDSDVTVLAVDGSLTDQEYLPLSLPYEVKADTPFLWHAQTPPDTFYLTAKTDRKTIRLCLTYEETENLWTICRVTAE